MRERKKASMIDCLSVSMLQGGISLRDVGCGRDERGDRLERGEMIEVGWGRAARAEFNFKCFCE